MAGFTSSSFQPTSCICMTWPWKFGRSDFLLIAFPSFMCLFSKVAHTSRLSFAFGTNCAPCKSSSGQIFLRNACTQKDQWHIMLYRDEGPKYLLVFNKQWENYKLDQYVQQDACSFATNSGYSWRFGGSFSTFCFRSWHMKTSGLKCIPLCVGSIFTGIQGWHKHFHHWAE